MGFQVQWRVRMLMADARCFLDSRAEIRKVRSQDARVTWPKRGEVGMVTVNGVHILLPNIKKCGLDRDKRGAKLHFTRETSAST